MPGGGVGEGGDSGTNSLTIGERLAQRLAGDGQGTQLPREFLDAWVNSGRTNADDLLAARQAGGGVEFLRKALELFPNDPRVLMAATVLDDDPEARRQRLDRFKAAAPDNPLADYLSARDHLKSGRIEQALADLEAAKGKSAIQDYTLEAMAHTEELYLEAGNSPAEAKMLGSSTALLPHLAQMKQLVTEIKTLRDDYAAAGSTAAAESLTENAIRMARQLQEGESGRTVIGQLVGQAIQLIALRDLPAESQPAYLDTSVGGYIAEIQSKRQEFKGAADFFDSWLRSASEADIVNYFDRLRSSGEAAALAWARERTEPKP